MVHHRIEDLEEIEQRALAQAEAEESNHANELFMEGWESDELPSDIARRDDRNRQSLQF